MRYCSTANLSGLHKYHAQRGEILKMFFFLKKDCLTCWPDFLPRKSKRSSQQYVLLLDWKPTIDLRYLGRAWTLSHLSVVSFGYACIRARIGCYRFPASLGLIRRDYTCMRTYIHSRKVAALLLNHQGSWWAGLLFTWPQPGVDKSSDQSDRGRVIIAHTSN